MSDIQEWIEPSLIRQLDVIDFCGNLGDPLYNSEFIDIIQYFYNNQVGKIKISTNGSYMSKEFWKNLGAFIQAPSYCEFGIDGIDQATHEIHRVRTHFNRIIENAQAFIQAGGAAVWQFIVFNHNEHQIDQARKMANDLGFAHFKVRKSARWAMGVSGIDSNTLQKPSVVWQHDLEKRPSFNNLDELAIKCKERPKQSIYIDYNGFVWPCCHIGSLPWVNNRDSWLDLANKKYGSNWNSLHYYTLEKIINGNLFARDLVNSWDNKLDDQENPKCHTCPQTCGYYNE